MERDRELKEYMKPSVGIFTPSITPISSMRPTPRIIPMKTLEEKKKEGPLGGKKIRLNTIPNVLDDVSEVRTVKEQKVQREKAVREMLPEKLRHKKDIRVFTAYEHAFSVGQKPKAQAKP